jgi:hypothetical protein
MRYEQDDLPLVIEGTNIKSIIESWEKNSGVEIPLPIRPTSAIYSPWPYGNNLSYNYVATTPVTYVSGRYNTISGGRYGTISGGYNTISGGLSSECRDVMVGGVTNTVTISDNTVTSAGGITFTPAAAATDITIEEIEPRAFDLTPEEINPCPLGPPAPKRSFPKIPKFWKPITWFWNMKI